MTKLEAFLKKVYETNEFYQNIVKEYNITDPTDITQYPILTRQQLQENRYNMFSKGYKSKYYYQRLRRQVSSGSSGVPVNVYWDYKNWYASNLSLWRRRQQWYGIKPNDRYVIFTLNAFNLQAERGKVYYINEEKNLLSINVSLLQSESSYEHLAELINEFSPKWLYIQPFVLNKLIQVYRRTGKKPPKTLEYIESVGELLASDLKRRAIELFEVPLANMYGSEEMNGIAYECPRHHMHVLEDNVLLEVNNNNSFIRAGAGDAIVTNLNNICMPLIRYDQGDKIIIKTQVGSCDCGDDSTIVDLIKGRSHECICLENEYEVNTFILSELVAEANNQLNDIIKAFKFEYKKSAKRLICLLYLEEDDRLWLPTVKEELKTMFLKKILPQEDISFEIDNMTNKQINSKKVKSFEIVE